MEMSQGIHFRYQVLLKNDDFLKKMAKKHFFWSKFFVTN